MCYTSSKLQTGILKMKKKKEIEKKDVVAQLVSSGIQIQVLDTRGVSIILGKGVLNNYFIYYPKVPYMVCLSILSASLRSWWV